MESWSTFILDYLAQFGGGRGGIENDLPRFTIGALFWAFLFFLALRSGKPRPPRERLLLWGFGLGFAREALMLAVVSLQMLGFAENAALHPWFPPLEHALAQGAVVTVAAGFLLFFLNRPRVARGFLAAGLASTGILYLAVAWWWPRFLAAHPGAHFGETPADWLFRGTASVLFAVPLVLIVRRPGTGPRIVAAGLSLFLLDQVLMLVNLAYGDIYREIYGPVRHVLYLAAIPLVGYVYRHEGKLERRRADETVRILFESVNDAIIIHDLEGRIIDANRTACERLGYGRDEFLALSLSEIDVPDDAALIHGRVQELRRRGSLVFESTHRRRDGSAIPVEVSARVIEIYGAPAVLSVARDVTDRREAQARLEAQSAFQRLILESLTHPFYLIDAEDYTIRMANPASGLDGLEGEITCYAATHHRTRPCGALGEPCPVDMIRATGKPVTVEHVHFDREGVRRTVEVHGFPVFDGAGKVTRVIEYTIDVSARKETEAELLRAKDRIIETMSRHNDYVFEVADRLRNPLQKLKGFTELFETEGLSHGQRESLGRIGRSVEEIDEGIRKLT